MESTETAKARAEGRVKLAAVVLVMLVLAGAVREYRETFAPSDEATVIYVSAREENAVEAVDNTASAVVPTEENLPERTVEAGNSEPQAVILPQEDGVAAFLGYMDEVNGDLEEMTKPESALDKIVMPVQPEPEANREELFEEGKIEIFDSEEGVIRTEEAKEAATENEGGQNAEAAETVQAAESVEAEPVMEVVEGVQTEESAMKPEVVSEENGDVFEAAEDDGEAIDLMKEIAERAAAEENGN